MTLEGDAGEWEDVTYKRSTVGRRSLGLDLQACLVVLILSALSGLPWLRTPCDRFLKKRYGQEWIMLATRWANFVTRICAAGAPAERNGRGVLYENCGNINSINMHLSCLFSFTSQVT